MIPRTSGPRRHRLGIGLVELLVVVGIVGVLAGLPLPAVQSARESARKARCSSNLRQLGIALHGYESTHGAFPMACGVPNYAKSESSGHGMKHYSAFTQLLPYLDLRPHSDAINFDVGQGDPCANAADVGVHAANATAFGATIEVLLCPSDGRPSAGSNYRVNLGADRWYTFVPSPTDGPLMSHRSSPASATTDGLSQTVAFGEKLRGRPEASPGDIDPRADMFPGGLGLPATAEESFRACSNLRSTADSFPCGGTWWPVGSLAQTCYNHVIGPNGAVPDCYHFISNPLTGLFGARSDHPGGLNVGMADGSVRSIPNAIARQVWIALGTRAGGEAVPPD